MLGTLSNRQNSKSVAQVREQVQIRLFETVGVHVTGGCRKLCIVIFKDMQHA
jgi:hypothetical protein